MTVEEKIAMLAGADMWHTVAIERLGNPAIRVTDGPIGARGAQLRQGPTSACFPTGIVLAATWNTDLIERVGAALGEETRAKGAHILLAPTVSMHRSPLAGVEEGRLVPRRIDLDAPGGLQQLGLFDDQAGE